MKYVIFGDESTIPAMHALLGDAVARAVVASNRASSMEAFASTALVQPPRSGAGYGAFASALAVTNPDVIISFSYSMVLGPDLLALPRRGAINLHGGLLPRYRGANVLNWAIIEGASETGVTAHFMTPKIDEGDIIYQEVTPIRDDDSAATLKARLDAIGLSILGRLDAELRVDRALPRRPQDAREARYYPRRRPEDGRIDWKKMSDREVFNLVRALAKPWPGAFFERPDGQRIVLDRYQSLASVAQLRRRYA